MSDCQSFFLNSCTPTNLIAEGATTETGVLPTFPDFGAYKIAGLVVGNQYIFENATSQDLQIWLTDEHSTESVDVCPEGAFPCSSALTASATTAYVVSSSPGFSLAGAAFYALTNCVKGFSVQVALAPVPVFSPCCDESIYAAAIAAAPGLFAVLPDFSTIPCGDAKINATTVASYPGCGLSSAITTSSMGTLAQSLAFPAYLFNTSIPCCQGTEYPWLAAMIRVYGPSPAFCLEWTDTSPDGSGMQAITYGPIDPCEFLDIYPPNQPSIGYQITVTDVISVGCPCEPCDEDP